MFYVWRGSIVVELGELEPPTSSVQELP